MTIREFSDMDLILELERRGIVTDRHQVSLLIHETERGLQASMRLGHPISCRHGKGCLVSQLLEEIKEVPHSSGVYWVSDDLTEWTLCRPEEDHHLT